MKRSVRFYLQKRKGGEKDKKWPVVIGFNYDGNRLYVDTKKVRVKETDWDRGRQRLKAQAFGALETNKFLDKLEIEINKICLHAMVEGITLNNKYIISQLSIRQPKDRQNEFFTEWQAFLDLKKNEYTNSSMRSVLVAFNYFRKFCEKNGISPTFDMIKPALLNRFRDYLLEIGNVNNTIHNHIKRLRTFMNHAYRLGLHNNLLFKEFKAKEHEGTIIYLTWEELQSLANCEVETKSEEQIRDTFVFGSYTGLRYSDTMNLKKTSIIRSHDKKGNPIFFADIREKKTKSSYTLPLLQKALQILEKYQDLPGDYALPQFALQTANKALKDIAKKAAIDSTVTIETFKGNQRITRTYKKWQKLTTHVARKTFISNAVARGMSIPVIMSMTNKQTYKSLKPYMALASGDKHRELLQYFPE